MKKYNLLLFLNFILFSCHSKLEIEPKTEPIKNNYSVKIYKLDDKPAKRKILDTIDSETVTITTKKLKLKKCSK